jgi:PAS domain-containing protein
VGSWADISDRKQAEQALGERMAVMKDLQTLVGASPAIIYTTQVSGDFACTFVSENLNSVMSYAPWEMRDDPKFWVRHLHPDDAARVFTEIDRLISQGGGASNIDFGIGADIMSGSRIPLQSCAITKASRRRS